MNSVKKMYCARLFGTQNTVFWMVKNSSDLGQITWFLLKNFSKFWFYKFFWKKCVGFKAWAPETSGEKIFENLQKNAKKITDSSQNHRDYSKQLIN
jgi:hypothetical protein